MPSLDPARWPLVLALLYAVLIFVPKVNVIAVPGSAVGVKPDDVAVAAALLLLLPGLIRERAVTAPPRLLGGLIAGVLVCPLVALLLHPTALGAAYLLRYAMYLSLFFVGYGVARRRPGPAWTLLLVASLGAVAVEFLWALAQNAGMIGGSQDGVWRADLTYRSVAQTANPIELALLLLVQLPVVLLLRVRGWRFALPAGAVVLALVTLFLTQSRAALLVAILALLASLVLSRRPGRVALLAGALLLAGTLPFLASNERIQNLLAPQSFVSLIRDLQRQGTVIRGDINLVDLSGLSAQTDPSLYIRLSKWKYLMGQLAGNPLGAGPGAFGPAVDGLYVRLLVESGVLGLGLFLALLTALGLAVARQVSGGVVFTVFLVGIALVSVVVDSFFFSRFAFWFWLSAGILLGCAQSPRRLLDPGQRPIPDAAADRRPALRH